MATTLTYRDIVDLPEWRSLSQPIAGGSLTFIATNGLAIAEDMRARDYAHPIAFFQGTANILNSYHTKQDAWHTNNNTSLSMSGTFGAGATAVFCPTFGPMGIITSGTTTSVTLSTALPASVNTNQLSDRGDGKGFIIRIISNTAGGAGKIEERRIIGNTSGTTPIIYFDKALSFTPQSNDRYELLSGSVLFLNTTTMTTGTFRKYDVATGSFSNLSVTSMPTIAATHNTLVALDEQYVSYDRNPGEGYLVGTATYDTAGDFTKKCLTATATAAGTITGQASGGDAAVLANQFRNYQIRIVEDTTTPTAVGQRRRITSHTIGASPVYTLASNWTVTPSSTAKFVIENDTDRIIGFFGGQTSTYNYYISNLGNTAATANTWDTTSWAARSNSIAAGGLTWYAFGISSATNASNTVKPYIISFRGGSTTYDVFDITGAATGSWTQGLSVATGNSTYDNFTGGSDLYHFAYNPHTQGGRYIYFALGVTTATASSQRHYAKFDSISGLLTRVAGPKIGSGTSSANAKSSFVSMFQDGDTKIAFYNTPRYNSSSDYFQLILV